LLALVAPGCAARTAPAVQPAAGAPPAVVSDRSGADIRYARDVITAEVEIRANPVAVWQALALVHHQLELPIAEANAREGVMRSGRFRAPRRIDGQRLATFLDCGSTMTGLRTENSDVYVEMTSVVREGADGSSRVATSVLATARNREGTSTAAVPCTSTGALEKRVATLLRERLGG
jgi:hypothetical protein